MPMGKLDGDEGTHADRGRLAETATDKAVQANVAERSASRGGTPLLSSSEDGSWAAGRARHVRARRLRSPVPRRASAVARAKSVAMTQASAEECGREAEDDVDESKGERTEEYTVRL